MRNSRVINASQVSVIIPSYNYGAYLEDAIVSVLQQTVKAQEIIVINDGSEDNTVSVAQKFPVKLINNPHQGVVLARNCGICQAQGEFILPLDADDKLHPQFLEKTLPIIQSSPNIGVVYTHRVLFGKLNISVHCEEFSLERLMQKNIVTGCALFKKSIWLECGGYHCDMELGYEDWDFWLAIAKRSWEFKLVPDELVFCRKHEKNRNERAKHHHNLLVQTLETRHREIF